MKSSIFFLKYHFFIVALLVVLLIICYFISGNEYLFFTLAFLLLGSASFLLSLVSSKWLLMLLAFCIPFSVQTDIDASGINIFFPSELLEGVCAGAVLIKIINRKIFDSNFFYHPITLLLLLYFSFTLTTGFVSTIPVVSLKAILVKGIYFLVFYFLAVDSANNEQLKSSLIYLTCYSFALLLIILYTLNNHFLGGFEKEAGNFASLPFYRDHTIYSTCVAFMIPVVVYNVWRAKKSLFTFFLFSFIFILFCVGLFYSFSRAAWISIFAALIFFIILLVKIRPVILLAFSILIAAFLFQRAEHLLIELKQNKSDSNMKSVDLEIQTKSIVNISNDQSNAERLNRWKCALRMFYAKPFSGFGSGTYMFRYFDFQRKADMTYISVTSPYNAKPGHGGSVHSEYFLVLAENGIFTFTVFLFLILKIILTGIKNTYHHADKKKRMEAGVLTLALITYLIHGLFNNFLDTDKAAFLFWSSAAMLVVIDLSRQRKM